MVVDALRALRALMTAQISLSITLVSVLLEARHDALATEGDLRRRSLRQRRAFDRLGLDEAMFFADASAADLDALRLGSKWAFRARGPLNLALAA